MLALYLHEPFKIVPLRKDTRAQRRKKDGVVPLDGCPISFPTLWSYFSAAGKKLALTLS